MMKRVFILLGVHGIQIAVSRMGSPERWQELRAIWEHQFRGTVEQTVFDVKITYT